MKKVFTLIAGVVLSLSTFAQQIPNGSFEHWATPLAPDHWGTIASAFGSAGYSYFAIKDTSAGNHPDSTASLKMVADTVNAGSLMVVPGQAGVGTATYVAGSGIVFSGIPYTKRIDTIYFDYKYAPARVVDTALMGFNLTKAGVSLFGGELDLPISTTSGLWKSVYLPLFKNDSTQYYTTLRTIPDTLHFFFYAALDTGFGPWHSALWIDGLHFDAAVNVTGPNGIADLNGKVFGVNVYPNPANSTVNVAVESDEIGANFQLFDIAGREVYNAAITSDKFAIDTRNLQSGVYSIRVNSTDKMTTYKGKISIVH